MAATAIRYQGSGTRTHAIDGVGTHEDIIYTVPAGKRAKIIYENGDILAAGSDDINATSCYRITGAVDATTTCILSHGSQKWIGQQASAATIAHIRNNLTTSDPEGVSVVTSSAIGFANKTGSKMPYLLAAEDIRFTTVIPNVGTEGFNFTYHFTVLEEDN